MTEEFCINHEDVNYTFDSNFGYFVGKDKVKFCGKCLIPDGDKRIVSPLFHQGEIISIGTNRTRYTHTSARWVCNMCDTYYLNTD